MDNGRYVIVELLTPDSIRLHGGRYDVHLQEDRDEEPVAWRRTVQVGRNASAAEWSRLHDEKDRLNRVAEVMES